jgi:hypothetical protein
LETKRLILDDGMLTSGHRITEFHVWAVSQASGDDPGCILGLQANMGGDFDASDNRQIGWASQTTTATTREMKFSLIDPDHIIIRDLFIQNISNDLANYLVVIEPVSLNNDQAVLQLIKERSQDDLR